MKIHIKIVLMAAAVAAFTLMGGPALAFHEGGVAACGGCHSMHAANGVKLLTKADASSTCLRCHERTGDTGPNGYHISTPAAELAASTDLVKQRTPGGDFGWLRQNLSALASYGAPVTNNGVNRGHNIVAVDNSYVADTGNAPGGTMPAANLSCVSCHDPHGRARRDSTGNVTYPGAGGGLPIVEPGSYGHIPAAGEAVGVYRLLGGSRYPAGTSGSNFPGAPAAVVNEDYNRTEEVTQTRVAYGYSATGLGNGYTSWGKWCASCHVNMHTDTPAAGKFVHKVDDTLGAVADTYNAYVKTGDLSGGTGATAFTSLVPFAKPTTDVTTLAALALVDDSDLQGPSGTDRLACLSCHRAHASGWRYALRWNGEAEFLTLACGGSAVFPGTDQACLSADWPIGWGQFSRGYTTAQLRAAYYDRPVTVFADHQRSYCNKCHAKD